MLSGNFYPATFTLEENGGYTVSFRDIPEALTCGDNLDDAKEMAQDALICRRIKHSFSSVKLL